MVFISKKWDVSMRKLEWKKKNRHWSHIADRQGFTLVELIVTFALLAIFMTAVVACLPNITKIYTNLQAINHQKTICNTVSNQIRNELQSALGVEGVDDALGANKSKEIAYIALIDDSGNPITLTTGGAVSTGGALSTGGAIQPDTVSGRTIEFVLRDGIIAQLDTKGFTGYTMRKNKKMLHRTRTISPGALLTRYYELDDSDNKLMGIQYNSTDYSVASDAGIVNEGPVTIACAIDYPYAGQFYEGYDLETTFTIKKDAFYSYGDGTTASPKRTYVSYINYTLSLWKDGHMKYAQDYVVNVQNAVPYLGTKVAVDPVVPDTPSRSPYDAYVVEHSVKQTHDPWVESGSQQCKYQLDFHIPLTRDDWRDCDRWKVNFPYIDGFTWMMSDNNWLYDATSEDNNMYVTIKQTGYTNEIVVTIEFGTKGVMTPEEMEDMADLIHLTPAPTFVNCTASDATIDQNTISEWPPYQAVVSYTISAGDTSRVRERVEIEFDKEIESVTDSVGGTITVKVDGKKLIISGRMIEKNNSVSATYWVNFKNSDVKPSPATIRFGQ